MELIENRLDKVLETARITMERRGNELNVEKKAILNAVFEISKPHRKA